MQDKVIEYLQTDRSLLGGKNLYNNIPGKSLAIQNGFTRFTDTQANRDKVYYELCRAVGIPERQMKVLLAKPLKKKLEEIEVVDEVIVTGAGDDVKWLELTAEERLMAFDQEKASFFTSKELAKELNIKPAGRKGEDLYKALNEGKAAFAAKQLSDIPVNVKAAVKLRDQFPFLRETTCPDALKLLVNDLITAYETFKAEQPKLHDLVTAEESKAAVDVVLESYIDNKEAWAELEHYKANGVVLGKHPLFKRLELKAAITAMNTPDLMKKIKSLGINIGKNTKKKNDELVERDTDLLAHANEILKKR